MMNNNNKIGMAILVSAIGHFAFLAMPFVAIQLRDIEIDKDLSLEIDFEKPELLPDIRTLDEVRKIAEEIPKLQKGKQEEVKETIQKVEQSIEESAGIPEHSPVYEHVSDPEFIPEPAIKIESISLSEVVSDAVEIEEHIEITDPQEESVFRYNDMVMRRIQEKRLYPAWAKRQEYEGTAAIEFTVLSDGTAENVCLVSSTGYKILDQEAVDVIYRSSPFPPIPGEIKKPYIDMEIFIVFNLE